MNLNEDEKRMVYQIESTNQVAALNEIYMTWRYAPNQAMKDTAESLLKKLRPLSDKECMDVIREVQQNYRLPGKARTNWGNGLQKPDSNPALRRWPVTISWPWSGSIPIPDT